MKPTNLNIVLGILGLALLVCLGGIVYLAAANPARAIPDILVGTTTLIVGGVIGLLVPSRPTNQAMHGWRTDLFVTALVIIAVAVIWVMVHVVSAATR